MLGPSHLDLARTLANEHLRTDRHYVHQAAKPDPSPSRMRQWAGQRLIGIGERLAARPAELQLKVSTGPPSP